MRKKIQIAFFGLLALFAVTGLIASKPLWAKSSKTDVGPVKGIVTMIDLGAKSCLPCKMMAPILEKLEKVCIGNAVIMFVDLSKNREPAKRYRIRAIPTQIFFNEEGKEVYRHVGFMGEKAILGQLKKMGVQCPQKKG